MLKVPKATIGRLLRQEAELRTKFREKGKGHVSLKKSSNGAERIQKYWSVISWNRDLAKLLPQPLTLAPMK